MKVFDPIANSKKEWLDLRCFKAVTSSQDVVNAAIFTDLEADINILLIFECVVKLDYIIMS